jgi:hypothetical protein
MASGSLSVADVIGSATLDAALGSGTLEDWGRDRTWVWARTLPSGLGRAVGTGASNVSILSAGDTGHVAGSTTGGILATLESD